MPHPKPETVHPCSDLVGQRWLCGLLPFPALPVISRAKLGAAGLVLGPFRGIVPRFALDIYLIVVLFDYQCLCSVFALKFTIWSQSDTGLRRFLTPRHDHAGLIRRP